VISKHPPTPLFWRPPSQAHDSSPLQQATPYGMALKAGHTETADALRATESREIISSLPACEIPGDVCSKCYGVDYSVPPCPSKCVGDRSSLRDGADQWGCKCAPDLFPTNSRPMHPSE
jgi:hypothetical protein